MIQHYVEYFYPGLFLSETSAKRVIRRTPKSVKIPKNCYAFRFFDREEVKKKGQILRGERENFSGLFYVKGSRQMTLKEVKTELPKEEILISNMEINNWRTVVKTIYGQFMPFDKKDTVL